MSTPSDVMQIYGGMPASPTMVAGTAKMLADQENRKLQQAHDAQLMSMPIGGGAGDIETSRTVSTGGKNGGLNVSVKQIPKHEPKLSFEEKWFNKLRPGQQDTFTQNKLTKFPPAFERYINNINAPLLAAGKRGLSPEQENAEYMKFKQSQDTGGLQKVAGVADISVKKEQIVAAQKELNKLLAFLPPEYQQMAKTGKLASLPSEARTALKLQGMEGSMWKATHKGSNIVDAILQKQQDITDLEQGMRAAATTWTGNGGASAAPASPQTPAQMNGDQMRKQLFGGR